MARRAERLYIDFSALGYSARRKEHMRVLQDAVARNRCVSFSYTTAGLESSTRVVEPYAIVFKWYSWYLFAWCRSRRDFRLFRLSRIRNPVLKPEVFRRRDVNVQGCIDALEAKAPTPVTTVLRFKPELRVLVEDYFSFAEVSTDKEGRLIVKIAFPEDNWLYGQILSFGDGVEVISPRHIREKIAEVGEKIAKIYL